MTEQDKVTIDDIIGIVKTEEQTNSVEEVRKLRGRGNETAKRLNIDLIEDLFVREELIRLYEENEQLKTTIQQLTNDNTKQKKKLNTTMKENEHIKQTIKNMINTERTEIGKMTLRHLWRQIQ